MDLIKKYNVQAPRYTSYPTVPYWSNIPKDAQWKQNAANAFKKCNSKDGISVYIHLPFCQSLCTYCGCTTRITTNHKVEQPYINAVQKEWNMYFKLFNDTPRIKEIHLGGGTPTFFSPAHLEELIKQILSVSKICENHEFGFEAHPNNTTYRHLETLYNLGFSRLSLGIQDFDPIVQRIVNRIQTFDNVDTVTSQARMLGYKSINFDLIYGLPLQKQSSVITTINKVMLLRPDRIALYSYAHVPWVKPGQRQFTEIDLPKDEEKRKLYETARDMLESKGYVEIGMDHFALKTDSLYKAAQTYKLHRNFMGYTPNYTGLMLGLGVSAISDTWECFVQNEKVVEDYYQRINQGELPFFRGHLLNEEDKILRKHILNIMCRYETSWVNKEEQTPAVYNAISLLREMEIDGLIKRAPNQLKVTEEGKKFIRNICMAFDDRLLRKTPEQEVFSKVI